MNRSSKVVAAFLTVCLAWGASYFAIRVGLQTFPPLAMGAIRYAIAGLLMLAWCRWKREEPLTKRQWMVASLYGLCFVVVGNGTILWAERTVPSGVAALLVAITPIGTLLLEWIFRLRGRPSVLTWLGLALGLGGILLLAFHPGTQPLAMLPIGILLLGTLGWSLGSVLSIKWERPLSPLRALSAQMLVGSAILLVLSGLLREDREFHPATFSLSSVVALCYLILAASIAAYIAYGYLMVEVSPTAAGACSYVNPIVAMLLGLCMGEPLGPRDGVALVVVLGGVGLISSQELIRLKRAVVEPAPTADFFETAKGLVGEEVCA